MSDRAAAWEMSARIHDAPACRECARPLNNPYDWKTDALPPGRVVCAMCARRAFGRTFDALVSR